MNPLLSNRQRLRDLGVTHVLTVALGVFSRFTKVYSSMVFSQY